MAAWGAIARRYAAAYFDLASEAGDLPGWREALARVAEVLASPDVEPVLHNPGIASQERARLAESLTEGVAAPARNLARLLVQRGRVRQIGAVLEEFERLVDRASGVLRAEVTSAVPLDDRQQRAIATALADRLGGEVKTTVRRDPSILGGLVIRIGDRVIDGSVGTRLEQLRAALA